MRRHAEARRGLHFFPPDTDDPDPRFTLANERTFLAWSRTALALIAGGIAIEAFATGVFPTEYRRPMAVGLFLLGSAISLGSAVRWYLVERAIREDRPLPKPLLIPFLAIAGAATGAVLTWLFFVDS